MKPIESSTLRFFRYFVSTYRWRTALMVILLLVGGLLEGVSVVTLIPLLESAAAPGAEPTEGIVAVIHGVLRGVGVEPTLGALVALVIAGITLKAGFIYLAMRQVGFMVARVALDLRLRLVRALLAARWSYFGEQPTGRFANTIGSEVVRSSAAFMEACIIVAGLLQVAVYVVIAGLISWQVSLVAIGTALIVLRGLRRYISMGRSAGEEQTRLTKSLASRLVDALQGMKPMKAMAREELFWPLLESEAKGLNRAHRKNVVATQSLQLFHEPIVTLVLGLGLLGLLTFADRSFSAIVVLAFVFYRLMTHWNTLQMRYQVLVTGESAFWSLWDQIEEAESAVEEHPGDRKPDGLRDEIFIKEVDFAYGELQVLRKLSMRVPAGRITALIGRSGSGKTTIVDLVAGLQQPDSGNVHVDGVPMEEIDIKEWRRLLGYVPQEVFLFHDTVRRNITLGDDSISDARVEQALKDAGAWEFISREPEGIHAMVAPQGSAFSGGQRQRLAIARALVKRPALLILDEATTGLDAHTEAAILETLTELRGSVTILAISHQAALRGAADIIYELQGGEITGREEARR